jgi:Yip1-like protein
MSASNESFQAPPPPPMPVEAPKSPRPGYLRVPAIVIFVLGFVLLVGGAIKILTGGIGAGIALVVWGMVLFGLSFVPLPQVEANEDRLTTLQTLLGVFYEPTRVFRDLRARPRWVAAFVVVAVLSVAYGAAFVRRVTPERIVNFNLDKVAESGFLPADRLESQRQIQIDQAKSTSYQVLSQLGVACFIFLKSAFLAGLFMLGIIAFGSRINFWQAFSAVLYVALPWTVIQKVLSLVLLYLKSPDDIHPVLNRETMLQDNLGILVKPAEHPVLFVLLSVFGLLWFYWIWLTARSLRFTGTKVSDGAAWGVTITLTLLMILLGVAVASLFGSFFG